MKRKIKKNLWYRVPSIEHRASRNRATFTIEYAALIIVLVLALLAMQLYLKRSMFGRLRGVGDTFGQGKQYEPYLTTVTKGN
ncbi:MAG: hypothetical protein PHY46_02775 [Candidatus Omnitrophica bacterium]|nr:hypothetical protein [Candidatus Omnitrophota bacterium]